MDRSRVETFSQEIWEWFARFKRTLPWRDLDISNDTQRAYMILVSEVMLQQTQVSRVIVIFRNFLERFPTIRDIAVASNKDVIMAWKGMGYNSRALRLRDAAKTVVEKYAGQFPHDLDALLSIKGIGPYTAAAIRNFAFGIPTPCVDTNIYRILHRVFLGPEPEKADGKTVKKVMEVAGETLKIALDGGWRVANSEWHGTKKPTANRQPPTASSTADWHAALMDFGSLVCTKNSPKCDICPLANGSCKSAFKVQKLNKKIVQKEPGRLVGSKFIPNRIFRGRIVEALREHQTGLKITVIGKEICIDWSKHLEPWLDGLLKKLVLDELIEKKGSVYRLKE